ncbi:MAG: ribonuclease J [Alphaproteobacteria bacterium]|nr:ribonuclease J [Alphaproteobacteria bacterium]
MKLKLREDRLYFWPVSGSGQIGRNFNLYGFSGEWIIVDWGVSFNQGSGVDIVFPDHTVLAGLKKNLKACIITHGHEDHYGALHHFWKDVRCPIYATPFTAGMIKYQFEDNGVSYEDGDVNVVKLQQDIEISKNFTVRFVPVNHSIPDAAGVYIKTPEVKVFHTGDWRIDPEPILGRPTKESDFKKIKSEGVDILVCDSTSVNTPEHQGSETEVARNLLKIFAENKKKRIFVGCFASNVERMMSVAAAAKKHKRKLCLLGRSFSKTYTVANDLNYLKNFPEVVTPQEAADMPDHAIAFVCSGSQGEDRASLSMISGKRHRFINFTPNDIVVFSSRNIPGNEKRISDLKNNIELCDAHVISNDDLLVHVSGHPSRAELLQMYKWTKPNVVIPVHGEYYHLAAQKALSEKAKMISVRTQNGHLYECSTDDVQNVMQAEVKTFGMDGKRVISMDSSVLRARDRMGTQGVVVVNIPLSGSATPDNVYVSACGVWEDTELDAGLGVCVKKCIQASSKMSLGAVAAAIKGAVVRWVRYNVGKNPIVIVAHPDITFQRSNARGDRHNDRDRGDRGDRHGNDRDRNGRRRRSSRPVHGNVAQKENQSDNIGNIKPTKGNKRTAESGNTLSGNTLKKEKDPYADIIAKYIDE